MDPPTYERASKMEGQRYKGDAAVLGVVARETCPHWRRAEASDTDVVEAVAMLRGLGVGASGDGSTPQKIVELFVLFNS